MKHIQKGEEPIEYRNWKRQNPQKTYTDLKGNPKNVVKSALIKEQGSLCCYCEQRVTPSNSHIEHLIPQSHDASKDLDYQNLLCSCVNQQVRGTPNTCGHRKGDWYDAGLLISPLEATCETRFAFTADGGIYTAKNGDGAAAETIERLGLNEPILKALRCAAIDAILEDIDGNLDKFVNAYLQKKNDKYMPFWTTIKYLFA